MEEKKKGRGGWRGGGRPRKNRKALTIYIDQDLRERLAEIGNKSDYINDLLRCDNEQNVK